jgi:hypothetical protein
LGGSTLISGRVDPYRQAMANGRTTRSAAPAVGGAVVAGLLLGLLALPICLRIVGLDPSSDGGCRESDPARCLAEDVGAAFQLVAALLLDLAATVVSAISGTVLLLVGRHARRRSQPSTVWLAVGAGFTAFAVTESGIVALSFTR